MPNHNRRQFLRAVGLTAGSLALPRLPAPALAQQERSQATGVRRNIADLAAGGPELRALRAGVAEMKRRASANPSDPLGWTGQADVHARNCPHANWFFLPWHRAYLLYFEQICRQASGDRSFMLPYWDWSAQRRIPQPLWGSRDNPLSHAAREATPDDQADEGVVGQRIIDDILATPSFEVFASPAGDQREFVGYGWLEGQPHNHVHNFVGGDMTGMQSPLDPIFWLHHCNVDRLFSQWLALHPDSVPRDAAYLDYRLQQFFDAGGRPVTPRVRDLLNDQAIGYRYDRAGAPAPEPDPDAVAVARPNDQTPDRTPPRTQDRTQDRAPDRTADRTPDRTPNRAAADRPQPDRTPADRTAPDRRPTQPPPDDAIGRRPNDPRDARRPAEPRDRDPRDREPVLADNRRPDVDDRGRNRNRGRGRKRGLPDVPPELCADAAVPAAAPGDADDRPGRGRGRAVSTVIRPPGQLKKELRALAAVGKSKKRKKAAHLAVQGAIPPAEGLVSVRVFVNNPDANVDTPTSDPSYLGAFSFFALGKGGHGAHDHGDHADRGADDDGRGRDKNKDKDRGGRDKDKPKNKGRDGGDDRAAPAQPAVAERGGLDIQFDTAPVLARLVAQNRYPDDGQVTVTLVNAPVRKNQRVPVANVAIQSCALAVPES